MGYSERSHRLLFWGVWLGFLLPAGASTEEPSTEVTGILGQSATFALQSPRPFDVVLWSRNEKNLASWKKVKPSEGEACRPKLFRDYTSREVSVSPDCSSLTVKDLRKEDSGRYRAQFQNLSSFEVFATQTFILNVYKHLSEADLEVTCAKEMSKDGNETLHLNCSVGKWGDGVEFSWASSGRSGKVSSETSLVLFPDSQGNDQNVTCMVKNHVSNASRTISLKQACEAAGQQPVTRPPTVADRETGHMDVPSIAQTVTVAVVVAFVVIAAVAAVVLKCRRKKAAGRELIPPSSDSGPKDKSVYVEIPPMPEIQDAETDRTQQQRGPGAPKEMPVTIYADVQHSGIPSQTDDEKIRREKQKAAKKREKTIYSEIGDPKETNKGTLNTIYDTVNLSRPPEVSEYNKIL